MNLMEDLEGLASRGYSECFFRRHLPHEMQQYEKNVSGSVSQKFVGEVLEDDRGKLMVDVKNRFQIGDDLELMTPAGNYAFKLGALLDKDGVSIDVAPGSGHFVEIPELPAEAMDHGLLIKNL